MGSINNLSSSYLQSALTTALQATGLTPKTTANSTTSVGASADSGQLSPLAQLMSTLQQLQQTDPAKYQQVTGQIATNLQNAAQTAQSNGNTAAAGQLSQLSTDFSNASKSGQLPNIQDLAKAVGGHHHHGHHAHASGGDNDGDSSSSSTSTSGTPSATGTASTAASTSTTNQTTDPLAIILNTLSSASLNL
jgi:hypothetical protein